MIKAKLTAGTAAVFALAAITACTSGGGTVAANPQPAALAGGPREAAACERLADLKMDGVRISSAGHHDFLLLVLLQMSSRYRESAMTQNTRIEADSLGQVEVSADVYWGAHTQRSLINFPFGPTERMPIEIIHALAWIKQAAAKVNRKHGLDASLADAIEAAAAEISAGKLDDQFPLVIWQTGSGTQTNMNVNEVIAGRANEMVTGRRGGNPMWQD